MLLFALQNSSAILTEICMDFDRNFIFWPKFWPTLVRRKNCGRNFFLTDRSKYCDRHFDRLTSVKIKIWPRFLTEKSVKKKLRPHFDRSRWSKSPVWPILTACSVKITAQKPPAKPQIQNFDRHRWKFRSKFHNFDRKSVKIMKFWPKF